VITPVPSQTGQEAAPSRPDPAQSAHSCLRSHRLSR